MIEDEEKPRVVPVAFVAQMLGTTIPKARRKFGERGYVPIEELMEWVEKHSDNVHYLRWLKMLEKADKRIQEEISRKEAQ